MKSLMLIVTVLDVDVVIFDVDSNCVGCRCCNL